MADAELLFRDEDWPFGGLHEIADPLDEALMAAGAGEVVGGGIGGGFTRLRLTLEDEAAALAIIQALMEQLDAPASTRLRTAAGLLPVRVAG
jgi:hypothetical protein